MAQFTPNFTVIHNGIALHAGHPVEIAESDADVLAPYGKVVKAEKPASKPAAKPVKTGNKKEQAKVISEEIDDIL